MKSEPEVPTPADQMTLQPGRLFIIPTDHGEDRRISWVDPQICMSMLILEAVVRRLWLASRLQTLQQTCESLWLWHVTFVPCRPPGHVRRGVLLGFIWNFVVAEVETLTAPKVTHLNIRQGREARQDRFLAISTCRRDSKQANDLVRSVLSLT